MKAILNLWGFEKEIQVSDNCYLLKLPMAPKAETPRACGILFSLRGDPKDEPRRLDFEGFLYPTAIPFKPLPSPPGGEKEEG